MELNVALFLRVFIKGQFWGLGIMSWKMLDIFKSMSFNKKVLWVKFEAKTFFMAWDN